MHEDSITARPTAAARLRVDETVMEKVTRKTLQRGSTVGNLRAGHSWRRPTRRQTFQQRAQRGRG